MSVECMSRVFKKSESTGNDRFVLLAIADNAWEDGTNSWPSVALLAWKTGLSERTVRRCLDNLEKLGELRRDYRTGTSTMYSVLISDKKPDRARQQKIRTHGNQKRQRKLHQWKLSQLSQWQLMKEHASQKGLMTFGQQQ